MNNLVFLPRAATDIRNAIRDDDDFVTDVSLIWAAGTTIQGLFTVAVGTNRSHADERFAWSTTASFESRPSRVDTAVVPSVPQALMAPVRRSEHMHRGTER